MLRCSGVLLLLLLVHLGQGQENRTDVPLPTSEQPSLLNRFYGTIAGLFRSKKPEHTTNSTLQPPTTEESRPADVGNVERDAKCLPPEVQNNSVSTESSEELLNRFFRIFAEINKTKNGTFHNETVAFLNSSLPNGSSEADNALLRIGKELLIEISANGSWTNFSRQSTEHFRNSTSPNGTSATKTSSLELFRHGHLDFEDLNSTFLQNHSSRNQSAHPRNSDSLEEPHRNRTKHPRVINKHGNETGDMPLPRALFVRFYGIAGKNNSKSFNNSGRIARYHSYVMSGNDTHDRLNRYLTLVRRHNWTYNGYARHLSLKNTTHREYRKLYSYDNYEYYNYYDDYYYNYPRYRADINDENSSGASYGKGEHPRNFTAGTHVFFPLVISNETTKFHPKMNSSDSRTYHHVRRNETVVVLLNKTHPTPERDAREIEFSSGNLSHANHTFNLSIHKFRTEPGNATSSRGNVTELTNSTSVIRHEHVTNLNITPRSDIEMEILIVHSKLHVSMNESTFNDLSPKSIEANGSVLNQLVGVNETFTNVVPKALNEDWWNKTLSLHKNVTKVNETADDFTHVVPKAFNEGWWNKTLPLHKNVTKVNETADDDFTKVVPKAFNEGWWNKTLPLHKNLTKVNETADHFKMVNVSDLQPMMANISDFETFLVDENGTFVFDDIIPRDQDGNSTGMMFTIRLNEDNTTHNGSTLHHHNMTKDDLHLIFQFLKGNFSENSSDRRHSYNTSVGSYYDIHPPRYESAEDINYHLGGPRPLPRVDTMTPWFHQPPFVWHPPSLGFRLLLPPPLQKHFQPQFPNKQLPIMKLVCPPTSMQGCPYYIAKGTRKCYVPMDCPRSGQLCCRVGCGVECIDGILVPIEPHLY